MVGLFILYWFHLPDTQWNKGMGNVVSMYAVLYIEVSSFQGVLIRGAPAVLLIEVSSFQGVLIRGFPAVLFIKVSSFQGVLIRGVPAVLFIKVSSES